MEEQLKYCGSDVRPGFDRHDSKKVFSINLVLMYCTLNSIYMQFEFQYPKLSNVSVEHVQLLRGTFEFFEPREILRSFIARGMYCLKLV